MQHVSLKIERAKVHVSELQAELNAFMEAEPYEVGAKHDPETRKLIYYVSKADPIPDRIPLIVGDAIQNLRTALDRLAYQLVSNDTGDNPPSPRYIYFPIAENAARYEASKSQRLEGAKDETLNAIDALKPYKGGNDSLWALNKLNNIDKHRLLLTAGAQAAGMHLGQLLTGHLPDDVPNEMAQGLESLDAFLNPADKGFPLQPGFELYIGEPEELPNPRQQFRFQVVISEPEVVDGEPLLELVDEFVTQVGNVVAALAPQLE
jgi:hypothetical protein